MKGKIRLHHYANYFVIGLLTLVFSIITLTGGRLDNSLLFLLEKVAISIILAVSLSLVVGFLGELTTLSSLAASCSIFRNGRMLSYG